ncbi:MAG: DNA translocase FtsK [Clostridia bacterium]|nr:DNA translocase FtsK [Clostridia bacterium]
MGDRKDDRKNAYLLTRETFGFLIIASGIFLFLCCVTREALFSSVGKGVCTFMYGTFGYGCIFLEALLCYAGVALAFESCPRPSGRWCVAVVFTALCLFLLFQTVSAEIMGIKINGYGSYLSETYNRASEGISGFTCGGLLSALLVYPVAWLTTYIGAYVIFAAASLALIAVSYIAIRNMSYRNKVSKITNLEDLDREIEDEKPAHRVEGRTITAVMPEPVSYSNPRTVKVAMPNVRPMYVPPEEKAPQTVSADATPLQGLSVIQDSEIPAGESAPAAPAGKDYSQMSSHDILYGESGSAGDAYRSNLIYNDSSYFNHPVSHPGDYYSGFGGEGEEWMHPGVHHADPEPAPEEDAGSFVDFVYGEPVPDVFAEMSGMEQEAEREDARAAEPEEEPEEDASAFAFSSDTEDDDVAESHSFRGDLSDSENVPEPYLEDGDAPEELEEPDPLERDDFGQGVMRGRDSFTDSSRRNIFDTAEGRGEDNLPEAETPRSGMDLRSLFGADNYTESREERRHSRADLFDYSDDDDDDKEIAPVRMTDDTPRVAPEPARMGFGDVPHRPAVVMPSGRNSVPDENPAEKPREIHKWKTYKKPPISLLRDYDEAGSTTDTEVEHHKIDIIGVLDSYNIPGRVTRVIKGTKVTRYDVTLDDPRNYGSALKHSDDLQMALSAESLTVRRNYAEQCMSIEVPNRKSGTVGLKPLLECGAFQNSKPGSLVFGLGKTLDANPVCPDVTEMPHLLVAGTTGSGKSVCLNALIVSLIYKYGPEDLRFILVDPKQVEFIAYSKLPHLMINEILSDCDKVIKALNWAIKEMERRYTLFKEKTEKGRVTRDIGDYNAYLDEGDEKLCKIVIILDEFGDLMLTNKKEIEGRIIKLAQKARAAGIHLILATQRPSVDCITGLIKSNLPTRIGFKVNSFKDSQTIFDYGGAEKLLGKGDMYFKRGDKSTLDRIQGCFISPDELQGVIEYIDEHNEHYYDPEAVEFINREDEDETTAPGGGRVGMPGGASDANIDITYVRALKFVIQNKGASVTSIQRYIGVNYVKACKIIDWMEEMNYVTPSQGSKPRNVLLSMEEFTAIYGEVDD